MKLKPIRAETNNSSETNVSSKVEMASKRKAEEDTNPNPSKRIKITENNFIEAIPFEIPEIFALIAKNLLTKPRTLINLSRINSRTHHHMYSTSVWRQLGFEVLADSPNGVDPFALLVALQKLEHKRLVEKSKEIQRKIEAQECRCESRDAIRSVEFRQKINAKLGITNEQRCVILDKFYEELMINNTLTKEYIASIGKLIRREERYSLVPVTFEAITLVLTKSKKEVEAISSIGRVEKYRSQEFENIATVRKGFRRPDLSGAQTARKEFAENLFIYCTSHYGNSEFNYSCFMKYTGDNHVVVFVSQYHDSESALLHYWKIDLTTKKLLDFGSMFELAKKKQVLQQDTGYMSEERSFSKIRQVFNDVLECKLEHIYGFDLQLFVTDCFISEATEKTWTDQVIRQYY